MSYSPIVPKYTQLEIAKMMNSTQPHVSNWLSGKTIPSSKNLFKLAQVLEIHPEQLLNHLQTLRQDKA